MALQFSANFMTMPVQVMSSTSATNHDVVITSSVLVVLTTANNDQITGFVSPIESSGGFLYVANGSETNSLVFPDDTGSAAGNRVILPPGFSTYTLAPARTATFSYLSGIGWRPVIEGVLA